MSQDIWADIPEVKDNNDQNSEYDPMQSLNQSQQNDNTEQFGGPQQRRGRRKLGGRRAQNNNMEGLFDHVQDDNNVGIEDNIQNSNRNNENLQQQQQYQQKENKQDLFNGNNNQNQNDQVENINVIGSENQNTGDNEIKFQQDNNINQENNNNVNYTGDNKEDDEFREKHHHIEKFIHADNTEDNILHEKNRLNTQEEQKIIMNKSLRKLNTVINEDQEEDQNQNTQNNKNFTGDNEEDDKFREQHHHIEKFIHTDNSEDNILHQKHNTTQEQEKKQVAISSSYRKLDTVIAEDEEEDQNQQQQDKENEDGKNYTGQNEEDDKFRQQHHHIEKFIHTDNTEDHLLKKSANKEDQDSVIGEEEEEDDDNEQVQEEYEDEFSEINSKSQVSQKNQQLKEDNIYKTVAQQLMDEKHNQKQQLQDQEGQQREKEDSQSQNNMQQSGIQESIPNESIQQENEIQEQQNSGSNNKELFEKEQKQAVQDLQEINQQIEELKQKQQEQIDDNLSEASSLQQQEEQLSDNNNEEILQQQDDNDDDKQDGQVLITQQEQQQSSQSEFESDQENEEEDQDQEEEEEEEIDIENYKPYQNQQENLIKQNCQDMKKQMLLQMLKNSEAQLKPDQLDISRQSRLYVEQKVYWQFTETKANFTQKILSCQRKPKENDKFLKVAQIEIDYRTDKIFTELLNGESNILFKKILTKGQIFQQQQDSSMMFQSQDMTNSNTMSLQSKLLSENKFRQKEVDPNKVQHSKEFVQQLRQEKIKRIQTMAKQRAITEHVELQRKEKELDNDYRQKEKRHQELIKQHEQNMNLIKERQQQRESIIQSNPLNKAQKPLFVQIQQRYEQNHVLPSLEIRKQKLQEIRGMRSTSIQEVLDHEKKYKEYKREFDLKPKPQIEVNKDFCKGLYKAKVKQQIQEDEKQFKEQHQKIQEQKTEKMKKKKVYAEYIKEYYKPKVDPSKQKEVELNIRKAKQRSQSNQVVSQYLQQQQEEQETLDSEARQNLQDPFKVLKKRGNDYMQISKQLGRKGKKKEQEQMEEKIKKEMEQKDQEMKKYKINYLPETKQKRKKPEQLMNWEDDLNNDQLDENTKLERIYKKASMLDEQLRKQEQNKGKKVQLNDEFDSAIKEKPIEEYYLNNIKAKIALLNGYNNL